MNLLQKYEKIKDSLASYVVTFSICKHECVNYVSQYTIFNHIRGANA